MFASSLFAHRGFARYWWARLAGTGANQMLMLAVGWQLYDLTGSPWDLGLVGLLQFLPALALVLVAGHIVDRHQRARILAWSLGLQALTAVFLCLTSLSGAMHREWLLAIAVALGALRAFQMPAQQALTPCLVPAEVLPRALAFTSGGMQSAIIAGPALGGLLYVGGAELTYGVCAALLGTGSALCATIRYRHSPSAAGLSVATLLAGLRFVGSKKVVLGAISLDLFAVLLGGATALLALAVGGAADMVSVVIRQTLVQLETPDDMRGRVSSVNSVFIGASNQLGEFESGATAAWFGVVPSVVLGGIGTCLVVVAAWRLFPTLARRDRLVPSA